MKDESTEWKTRKPRYLRDLVQYLKSDDDIDKWMVGITSAAELIDLVTEETLAVWAVSLARQLVHLQDTFEQPEFIPALRAALISLMKKSDEATRYIIQFMSDRDCSLSRRVLLLDCIRQLTHYLNELPAPIDKEEAKILQPTGTVVWTSSRLQLATSQGTTKWMQRHSAIIQQLLDASLDNDPRSIILQDVLTLRAYITTLADMLALSKNSPDLWRLCHPFIELLMPLRYHPNPEIVEIVLVGFIAIVSTLNANVHTEFLSYIRPIHDWLTGLFTESAAVQLQPQIVTLGSALSAFSEKAEVNIHQMLDHLDIE
ncbi:telomere length regulation protein-domain-containing protein [Syncephalis plumigaleata]|nr:telomere length regulation protein-domain-containing protein [Syncephalis plumigaleata]